MKTGWLVLATGMFISRAAAQEVSLTSLLNDMVRPESVAEWPDPAYEMIQASSYDRRSQDSTHSGWFANSDQSRYIRREFRAGKTENVLLDEAGPGAVVRFWLTTTTTPGMLRIYLDNQPQPVVALPAFDLKGGPFPSGGALLSARSSSLPEEKGGTTLYLPIPFAIHCRITWEEKDHTHKEPRYYQIGVRRYARGTRVKTFVPGDIPANRALIGRVEQTLAHPEITTPAYPRTSVAGRLEPGDSMDLPLPGGSLAVRELSVGLVRADSQLVDNAFHQVTLRMLFDGQLTVDCPVDDFSGSGKGLRPVDSWYRTVNAGISVSRWVMPYRQSATVRIVNHCAYALSLKVTAVTTPLAWSGRTMYFHAGAREEKNLAVHEAGPRSDSARPGRPGGPVDWTMLDLRARGVYLGDTFDIFNQMHSWYGEGDQKIWTDGRLFPVEFGTGTGDYYNTSREPAVRFQTPFANAPRADNGDSHGWNTFTRARILDRIPFDRQFRLTWETLGEKDGFVDAAVVCYWYAFR